MRLLLLRLREVEISELYNLDNLIFITLEFDSLIKIDKFKTKDLFNIHFSLLPKYKGMYTSCIPLINGEISSGVTLHKIDNGIDTGAIIDQIKFEIDFDDNARSLYFKYLSKSKELFKKNAESLINRFYKFYEQPIENSSYYSKSSINFSDLNINFNKTAFEINNQFRGYTFREYQIPEFMGWGIEKTTISNKKSNLKPGTIVHENEKYFSISTIDYNLNLYKDYYPILWLSAKDNNIKNLKKALKYVSNINLRNNRGWSALAIASHYGSYESVQILLNNNAEVDCGDYNDVTPLMRLKELDMINSHNQIYNLLLDKNK